MKSLLRVALVVFVGTILNQAANGRAFAQTLPECNDQTCAEFAAWFCEEYTDGCPVNGYYCDGNICVPTCDCGGGGGGSCGQEYDRCSYDWDCCENQNLYCDEGTCIEAY